MTDTTAARYKETSAAEIDKATPQEPIELLACQFAGFYALVYRYLLHRMFDRELAEELTAQTFYKAAAHPRRLPGDVQQIQFWLIRVATNLANTHYRKARWQSLLFDRFARTRPTTTESDNSSHCVLDQQKAHVRCVLKALAPKYQSVVVLRYYAQMSFDQIATILGSRPSTVRTRLSRAIGQMRRRLDSRVSEEESNS